ncbi:MAG: phosphoribosylanthranilate isomerase [Eubacteriales bacterium]
MTKIKLCGLTRPCDIEVANRLMPEYVGFVFARESKRYLSPDRARELGAMLSPAIRAVGVFVNEAPERVAALLNEGVIDLAQLHGDEGEEEIAYLRTLTAAPIIRAVRIRGQEDIRAANAGSADLVLLDSGAGTGTVFDWELIGQISRPYFLAGGLTPDNVQTAVGLLHPYAVDVSSGIETDGLKDPAKMAAFVAAVRADRKEETI